MAKSANSVEAIPKSGTVTVACNIANGVILELEDKVERKSLNPTGNMAIETVYSRTGKTQFIAGPRYGKGIDQFGPKVGPYVLTHGVDAEFMSAWMKQKDKSGLVTSGALLVYGNEADARDGAKERREFKSGLEPLIPGVDDKGEPLDGRLPREERTTVGSASAMSTAELS